MKRTLLLIIFLLAFVNVGNAQYSNPRDGQDVKELEWQNAAQTAPPITNLMVFSGSGLNDVAVGGTYNGTSTTYFTVVIDGVSSTNTFKWKKGTGSYTTGVSITGSAQTLSDGVQVTFAATGGHILTDQWTITVTPKSRYWFGSTGLLQYQDHISTKTVATLLDFAAPPAAGIGNTTPRPVAATTLSSTGQYTNTVTDGTAPMVITSTTVVANLNAAKVAGGDWATPPAAGYGSGTPRPVAATTITCSSTAAVTGALTVSGQGTFNDAVVFKRKTVTLGVGAATFSAANCNVIDLTGDGGDNTVTSITGGIDGQVIRIITRDAHVTFSDASTLKLAGNLTGSADDVLTLLFDGTNWYELSRSVN